MNFLVFHVDGLRLAAKFKLDSAYACTSFSSCQQKRHWPTLWMLVNITAERIGRIFE